jgi:acyl-CoA thioester hydrolase
VFDYPVKVYYEDTDSGGVVYHANYLKYMERARSEWLASIGHPVDKIVHEYGVVFAVRHADLDFVSPARLMQELNVHTQLLQLGKVKLCFEQTIYNDGRLIAKAKIKIATLEQNSFTLMPIPQDLLNVLKQYK